MAIFERESLSGVWSSQHDLKPVQCGESTLKGNATGFLRRPHRSARQTFFHFRLKGYPGSLFFLDKHRGFCYTVLDFIAGTPGVIMVVGLWMARILVIMSLASLVVFAAGCADLTKDAKVKCPKCGAIFSFQEGLDQYQQSH
jgi:hypothetical protein